MGDKSPLTRPMAIRLTNTLTGKKEAFQPLDPPRVTLYACGVTVYDDCHVGHARGAVVFDVLCRFLKSCGFQVTYVRNITDVDDKIIMRAVNDSSLRGIDPLAACERVATRYIESFRQDFARLGLLPPEAEPRATEYVDRMAGLVAELESRGFTYQTSSGVYFRVSKVAEYGKLSGQKVDQMIPEEEKKDGKENPLDFALWKLAKLGEPSWVSRWGAGRPGWHTECTTMSTHLLGDAFDIHGGGQDLVFPHHENERAQALAVGKGFASVWLHNGLLTVSGQKMSKSLGNFVYLRDVLDRYEPDVIRMFFLGAHYRSPMDFTWERLEEAKHAYERIVTFLAQVGSVFGDTQPEDLEIAESDAGIRDFRQNALGFYAAMEDDLNTPKALASIYHLIEVANKEFKDVSGSPVGLSARDFKKWAGEHGSKEIPGLRREQAYLCVLRDTIRELCQFFGFFQHENFSVGPEVPKLISERDYARRQKDYATSDRIRKQLIEMGYIVEDTSRGTVVRKRL